jgi:hypothetical protein
MWTTSHQRYYGHYLKRIDEGITPVVVLMLCIIIVFFFVVVIFSNAGVVHSFHHGGGVVDRRIMSLTIPIHRQRRIDHLMNNDHSVSVRMGGGRGLSPHILTRRQQYDKSNNNGLALASTNSNNDDIDSNNDNDGGEDKFSFYQRIESIKTAILGGVVGSICSSPFIAIHDLLLDDTTGGGGSVATWEFDTDASAVQGALFAIVYRYCIRASDTKNDMLNMGVIGAFVLVRSTSRIEIPTYCTAIPLTCGPPLGYLDYTVLFALLVNGIEGLALFGSVAYCMEYAYNKAWISKFP